MHYGLRHRSGYIEAKRIKLLKSKVFFQFLSILQFEIDGKINTLNRGEISNVRLFNVICILPKWLQYFSHITLLAGFIMFWWNSIYFKEMDIYP